MKITFFIGGLSGGGAERVLCNLANHLSKTHKITIVTMSSDEPSYYLDPKIIRFPLITRHKAYFFTRNIYRYMQLRKYIKKTPCDLYVAFLPITINLLLHFRRIVKVPIIISERGDPYTRYKRSILNKSIMKFLYKRADGAVFQTDSAKEYYLNIINNNVTVIPNAINDDFLNESSSTIKDKVVLAAGRLNEQKNFSLLIKAFAQINNTFPDYKLVIYGEGPLRSNLEQLVDDLSLNKKVFLPGYTKELQKAIRKASVFVLSSNYEGMPNALMEAMALGVPSISTNCPCFGSSYLIENNVNGILVPVNDENCLALAMKRILSNREFGDYLGENAKRLRESHSSIKIYSQWEYFLENMGNNCFKKE